MIDIAIPALILFGVGCAIIGGCFGLLLGCCCAMSGEISREEEPPCTQA